MINIMIIDDDIIVRKGIVGLIESIPNMSVIIEASSGEEALSISRNQPADIVLLDIKMPGIGGYETMQRLLNHNPKLKIIVLSIFAGGQYPRHFMSAGASGYLNKGISKEDLELAIKKVYAGEKYITPKVAEKIIFDDHIYDSQNKLNKRELQVLDLICEGFSAEEIANTLKVSKKTIFRKRQTLYEKFNVKNDVQLALIASSRGIFDIDSLVIDYND